MATKKEVATAEETAVAVAVPDFMKNDAGRGLTEVGMEDVEIPRIKLLQAISPELEEGFKAGDFYHTVAETTIGSTIKIIPIYVFTSYILWRPRKDGGGILARAMDGQTWVPGSGKFDVKLDGKRPVTWEIKHPNVAKSGLAEWGSSDPSDTGSAPAATKMINLVCYLPDNPEYSPLIVTLQRSSYKVGRKLLGKMKMQNAPSFGMVYEMSSVPDTNPSGDNYLNFSFKGAGYVQDKELYDRLSELESTFRKAGVRIRDLEGLQGEEDEANSGEDSDMAERI